MPSTFHWVQTCEYDGPAFPERAHPWLDSVGKPDCRYYDLRRNPSHIRGSLEDLLPWSRYAAIEGFYGLLEQINAPDSALESNDCAFTGPGTNEHAAFDKSMQCSGRVMVLYRDLAKNTVAGAMERLTRALHIGLQRVDPEFRWGMVGTSIIPVRYLALPEASDQQLGSQLMISFWTWGDSEAESMLNLGRLLANLSRGLRGLC